MNRIVLFIVISLFPVQLFGQTDPFEQWNKNYMKVELSELLSTEKVYADSIESYYGDSLQFYFRVDKYRFSTKFTGNWRNLSSERKAIMNSVFKMIGVEQKVTKKIKREVEVLTDFGKVWMPIQSKLEKPFKDEILPDSEVYLYTLFMNQHSVSKGLINIFLISEFTIHGAKERTE